MKLEKPHFPSKPHTNIVCELLCCSKFQNTQKQQKHTASSHQQQEHRNAAAEEENVFSGQVERYTSYTGVRLLYVLNTRFFIRINFETLSGLRFLKNFENFEEYSKFHTRMVVKIRVVTQTKKIISMILTYPGRLFSRNISKYQSSKNFPLLKKQSYVGVDHKNRSFEEECIKMHHNT